MLKRLLKTLVSNPGYKIAALMFAVLLWSYVLATVNPETEKLITDVPVSFTNESGLNAQNLVVRGDRSEMLKNTNVSVVVDRNNYRNATKNILRATVDLSTIKTVGEYDLMVDVTPYYIPTIKIVSKVPDTVHVEVDELMHRYAIPVVVEFVGTKREDYYFSEPMTVPSDISLSGARKDVERVSKAVVTLDASQLKSYNDAMNVTLVDENGEALTEVTIGNVPSVIVKMDVLPRKSVPINRENLLVGVDKIAEGFRLNITNLRIMPDTVEIAAPTDVLAKIDSIDVAPIDVQGWSASGMKRTSLRTPESVKAIIEEVDVYVDISEIPDRVMFDDLPVAVEGAAKNHVVEITPQKVTVTITAGANSKLSSIPRGAIEPYIDVTGLEPGQHELTMQYHISEKGILPDNAIIAPSPATINVLIKE